MQEAITQDQMEHALNLYELFGASPEQKIAYLHQQIKRGVPISVIEDHLDQLKTGT